MSYETYFKDWEDRIGAFTEVFPQIRDMPLPAGSGPLEGLPFGIKDNIALEGFSLSCGSKMLQGLKAPYTATAVRRLLEAGCVPVGKTNLDEFAMGATTDNSAIKKTNNPWDIARVAGGSSGGAAAAVAAGLVPFALGSDTGGSVRQPAAFCGILGLKPTYGAVSRYGLAAFASSLEGIGILSDTASRCRQVFSLIRGSDPMDETSMDAPAAAPALNAKADSGKAVIGVLSHESLAMAADAAGLESEVRTAFETAQKNLAALGYTMKEVNLPGLKYAPAAFHAISTAEGSANMARFDGIRFGKRPGWAENPGSLMDKSRELLGDEVKLRMLLGTYVLGSAQRERYYMRALQIRHSIRRNFQDLLGDSDYSGSPGGFDALLFPVFPARAFLRGSFSTFALKKANVFTCCANLAGLPALSFPASVEGGLPVGVQLIGRAFAEGTLLDIAERYEKAHPFPHPQGFRKFWN